MILVVVMIAVNLHAAISLYTVLGCAYDILAFLAASMIRLEVAPHFDKPFFSKSFSSMWGKRWNLSVGNTLRDLIYDPIQEGEQSCPLLFWET